jgi:hypothetical protein
MASRRFAACTLTISSSCSEVREAGSNPALSRNCDDWSKANRSQVTTAEYV